MERPRIERLDEPPVRLLEDNPVLRERVHALAVISRWAAPSPMTLGLVAMLAIHHGLFLALAPRWQTGEVHPVALLLAGAKSGPLIQAGQWWRLLAAVWLHTSIPHLMVNLAGLLLLGQACGNAFGSGRMLLLFFAGGAVSFFVSLIASPEASVGASGAIHALLGALLVFGIRHRRRLPTLGRGWLLAAVLLFTAVTILAQAVDPRSDRPAHLGGLVAGAVLGGLLSRSPRLFQGGAERRSWPLGLVIVAVVSLALAAGVLGLAGLRATPLLPDPRLREARLPGLRVPLPSRWEAGRLVQGRCEHPLSQGTPFLPRPGETLCLRDLYGAMLLLGPPASVTPGVAVDPSLTGVGGLRTLLREEENGVERRWIVLSPQWALSVTFYSLLAEAYEPLLHAISGGIRLPR